MISLSSGNWDLFISAWRGLYKIRSWFKKLQSALDEEHIMKLTLLLIVCFCLFGLGK